MFTAGQPFCVPGGMFAGMAAGIGTDEHSRERRTLALLVLFFAVLTLLFTYPIWTAPDTYLTELADVRLITWTLAWDAHALVTDPAGLFDANIFFPHPGTLAYSESFLGAAVLVAPLNWSGHPVLAYNVLLLSAFILSGIGATLWVRHLTGSLAAGVLAGVVWAFAPSKFDQLAHLHMLVGQWIPFALLCCSRYVESGRARYLYATAGFAGLQFSFSMHYGLFLLPVLGLYGAALLVLLPGAQVRSNLRGRGKQLVVAGVLFAALTLPIAVPYMGADESFRPQRGYRELVAYSGRPRSFIAGSPHNRAPHVALLYERYGGAEANYFSGVVPMLLAAVALFVLLPGAACRVLTLPAAAVVVARAATAPRAPPWRLARRWAFPCSATLATFMALLHFGGFLAAWWGRDSGLATLVIDLCQSISPAVWLAGAATAMVFSMPLGWRRRAEVLPAAGSTAGNASGRWAGAAAAAMAPQTERWQAHLLVAGYLTLMLYLLIFGPLVLGWGEELGRGPYWLLYQWVFPFRGIRAVGRIGQLWVLFVGVLAGFALSWLLSRLPARRGWRGAAVLIVLSITVWEYRTWPLPHAEADPAVDPIYDWLAEKPGDFAVLHAPLQPGNLPWRETRFMLGSTRHWKRLVNGYSGFFPPDYEELTQTGTLTPEFFKLLRSDFPVRYLLVHDDWLVNEDQHARLQRLLRRNGAATFIEQVGRTYVFEVPRDKGRGSYVRRRFTADQLSDKEGIQFLVRSPQVAADETVIVLAGWGLETKIVEVGVDWEGARVEMPRGFYEALGGKPGSFELRAHKLVPLGETGALIASGFIADVQQGGAGVGLEATWFYRTDKVGLQVHTLERYGTRLAATEEFPATGAGAVAFRDYIASLTPDTIVALTIATGEWRPLAAATIEGIRLIGGDPFAADAMSQMVVVGRKGASRGQALLHENSKWASVVIDVPSPSVELIGIGLY